MTHSANVSRLLNHEGGPRPGTQGVRFGFFTDTTVCIGCKACEVACKEWNGVPENRTGFSGHSYDNTGSLGANAWRHVAFIEQPGVAGRDPVGLGWFGDDPGLPPGAHGGGSRPVVSEGGQDLDPQATPILATLPEVPSSPQIPVFHGAPAPAEEQQFRWLMSSDVCKHCSEAACLEVCPTGAIFYTEFRTVVVQDDVCNGCGYCVTACPYGVIERRESDGGAWKCTLCYDRMRGGKQPACAMACPTDSIQFGPLDELRERAVGRLAEVAGLGYTGAQLYGHHEYDGVGGNGAFFLLLDDPEVYGLPPDPVTPTRHIAGMWKTAAGAALALAAAVVAACAGGAGGGTR